MTVYLVSSVDAVAYMYRPSPPKGDILRRRNPTLKYNPKNVKTEISEIGVKMGNGTFTKENNVTIANARCGSISELSYKTLRVLRTNSIEESAKPYRV